MLRHGFGNDLGARPDAKRATNPLGPFVVQNLVAFPVDFRRSTFLLGLPSRRADGNRAQPEQIRNTFDDLLCNN